ncbi:MAG TPA: 6-phosphogluconolactonase [Devosia sp.]|nr:6-phosphogluconolactonase [Devosia sp.]
MAAAAASDIAAAFRAALSRQANVRAIFAAAPSQADTLAALVVAPGIDWSRVTAFHMDEYIGLPTGAPERFASWLDQHVFDRAPFGQVHRIVPEPDAQRAVAGYAALLNEAPIDIVCLGIGVNGHLAFNDPPVADFNDPQTVKIVDLDDVCRQQQVDDKCFPTFADVPRQAITLTIPTLLRGREMFCVVPGSLKRNAVRDTLYGPIATSCPASILRTTSACTLYLDPESDPDV